MINLLERMAAAARNPVIAVLGPRAGDLLEWSRVTGQVASFCLNCPGRRRGAGPAALTPPSNPSPCNTPWPMNCGPPVMPTSGLLWWMWALALDLVRQPPPVRLEGPDLVHLAGVAEELDQLARLFPGRS